VVRHAVTGDTHLLSSTGRSVFLALVRSERAMTVAELAQELAIWEDADTSGPLEAVLAEFERLGLATSCTL
jgi:hypothetical protein